MRVLLVLLSLLAFSANASYSTNSRTIMLAAERVGVDPITQLAITQLESGFKHTVKNKHGSSAGGLFQITDQTWRGLIKKYGKLYGFDYRTSKYNARANALMGAHLTADNTAFIKKVLRRDPTPGEIYMAHVLGIGGAQKLFKASRGKSAVALLPTSAAGNKRLFYTSKGKPRTAGQFRDFMNWKFAKTGDMFVTDFDNVLAKI